MSTSRDFPSTQARDVSELVNIALGQRWPIAAALGSPHVRNAFAHRDYTVEDDVVTLSPQRNGATAVSITLVELQDAVLELVETCAAMELALVAVAEGLEVEQWVSPDGIFLLRPLLMALGWDQIEIIEPTRGEVLVTARVEAPVGIAAIAYVVQPLRGSAETVQLHLHERGSERSATVELPVALFAEWSACDEEVSKEIAFVRLSAATILDGTPIMSTEQTTKAIAYRACQLASDRTQQFSDIRGSLGKWRGLARKLELDELQRDIGRAMRWRATVGSTIPVDPAGMDPLLTAAGTEIESPRAEILTKSQ